MKQRFVFRFADSCSCFLFVTVVEVLKPVLLSYHISCVEFAIFVLVFSEGGVFIFINFRKLWTMRELG